MKQLASFTFIITTIIFIFSCGKVNDRTPKQQQVDSVKIFGQDSTELVKSITDIWTDSTGNFQDSTISYFFYDTTNRRIFIDDAPNVDPNPSNHDGFYSYNSSYQFVRFDLNPATITDTAAKISKVISYNNNHIPNGVTDTYKNGAIYTEAWPVTMLPSGGYSIRTIEGINRGAAYTDIDTIFYTYFFGNDGTLKRWLYSHSNSYNTGWSSDSLIYDANGNITRVVEKNNIFPSPMITLFDIPDHYTKGNEFSTLNRILYNGVSQFRGFIYGTSLYEFYQFTQYPASRVNYYDYASNSQHTFNTNAQLDNKNRLVSFKMYNGDKSHYFKTVKISYYK